MTKYYRVLKDNFLWLEGAILSNDNTDGGYRPIDGTELWNTTQFNGGEYISCRVIENCPEYFIQVYPVSLLTKTIYKVKEEARAMMAKEYGQ